MVVFKYFILEIVKNTLLKLLEILLMSFVVNFLIIYFLFIILEIGEPNKFRSALRLLVSLFIISFVLKVLILLIFGITAYLIFYALVVYLLVSKMTPNSTKAFLFTLLYFFIKFLLPYSWIL